MKATKAKARTHSIDYLKYGFIDAPHDEGLALCLLCEHTPMKDNIFGSEAFIDKNGNALPAQRISKFPSKFGSYWTWCT